MAKNLREVMERLKHGYNIKIVERSGTPLRLLFPLPKIKEGGECGRKDQAGIFHTNPRTLFVGTGNLEEYAINV